MIYTKFDTAIRDLHKRMKGEGSKIHPERWQSIDVSKKPEAEMRELINVYFQVALQGENLEYYRQDIRPNIPWADDHFEEERAGGQPLNPGQTWKRWPWALSADRFRRNDSFSHTYAERFWPKYAGMSSEGKLEFETDARPPIHRGIRYDYGDLEDVAKLLAREPSTRQAFVPIWFPEDTGVVHGERVPCTLGYHFLMREGALNVFYPIRSCDISRHFRDDMYLTVRLLLWMLSRCRGYDSERWNSVIPGVLTMWVGSLHAFINDWRKL